MARQQAIFWGLSSVLLGILLWRLPINGWGSLVWLSGLMLLHVIRTPHNTVASNTASEEIYHAASERWLLLLVGLGMQAVPAVHLSTGLFWFVNRAQSTVLFAIGFVCLAVGLWLFWRSHVDLGRNWSVTLELREDHQLITQGVYARIRHPMYTAIILICSAQAVLISNWIAGPIGLLSFALMCIIRLPREERMMEERFGERYLEYKKRSGRLLPWSFRGYRG